jgi:hypothetical protein
MLVCKDPEATLKVLPDWFGSRPIENDLELLNSSDKLSGVSNPQWSAEPPSGRITKEDSNDN